MSDPLNGKTVLILGLARQGTALARWLVEIGARVIVSDMRPQEKLDEPLRELKGLEIEYVLGEHPLKLLDFVDVICISGGVPLTIPIIVEAQKRGIPLTNDSQIFLERAPCHVIGITGSAGKTTTTTLVGKMIDASGQVAWVGGNIGNPLIADLAYIQPGDLAVMELSSFQLEIMTTSPHIAAILNITPNHLDRHKTMEAYTQAKAQIIYHQMSADIAVLGRDDRIAFSLKESVKGELSLFSATYPADMGAWQVGDRLVCRPAWDKPMETVCTVDELNLKGQHNVLNVLAACAIAGAAGIAPKHMRRAVLEFEGVPHRLEVVRVLDEVTWINDSIATAPERVMAALGAWPDQTTVFLLGGRDKDLPWEDLMRAISRRARAVITFGEAGLMIAEQALEARRISGQTFPIEQVNTLDEAVHMAYSQAHPGDLVLLSPGCTSYDAYVDFEARGQHFRELVKGL